MPEKILIFTKVRSTARSLSDGLERRGYAVSTTGSKKKMLSWSSGGRADFVVVDMTESLDKGKEFCQKLREGNEYARIILVVSGRRKVNCEELDALLVAPLTPRKILNRIKELSATAPHYLVQVADVILDPKERLVRRGDHCAALTPKESRLLKLLMQRAGAVVSRQEIMRLVWDTEYLGDTRTIDVHIRWLRKKIEPTPGRPIYIRTLRGRGYCFEIPEDAQSRNDKARGRP